MSISDELVRKVELGGTYQMCVMSSLDGTDAGTTIPVYEVNNIESVPFPGIISSPGDLFPLLPDSIRFIYNVNQCTPWRFVGKIVRRFGAQISKCEEHLSVKLAHLMSLVLLNERSDILHANNPSKTDMGILNLLITGPDLLTLQRLTVFSTSFADRLVVHSAVSELLAQVSRDQAGTGTYSVEGGCVLLARGGVCLVPNLAVLNKDQRESLQKALENKRVAVDIPKRLTGTARAQQEVAPALCTVWACAQPSHAVRPTSSHGAWDSIKFSQIEIAQGLEGLGRAFIDRFELALFINEPEGSHDAKRGGITEPALIRAIGEGTNDDDSSLGDEDLRLYLKLASRLQVTFSAASQALLRGYYTAGRRSRMAEGDFPLNALKTLFSLAAAHARLSLREKVIDEDVVIAVLMFETTLKTSRGFCVVGLHHGFRPDYLMLSEDELKLRQFTYQLQKFCSSFAPSLGITRPREE
ncbi:minichromosome maintenance domain-containing protein 2 [Nematostella vectensis]|uniref:minichromosome maintenance domain-containing protein 2 n=1 Tax=Nematostella vectensis TaxID=45351 RepID=UPI002076F96B|nr:minichromosome maintenance domain-containing protein 2 [Nematostella vectensis]